MTMNTNDRHKLAIDPTLKDTSRSFQIQNQEKRIPNNRTFNFSSSSPPPSWATAMMPSSFFSTLAEVDSPLELDITFSSTAPAFSLIARRSITPSNFDLRNKYPNTFQGINLGDYDLDNKEYDDVIITSPPSEAESDSSTDEQFEDIPLDELLDIEAKTNIEDEEFQNMPLKNLLIKKADTHEDPNDLEEIEDSSHLSAEEEAILEGYIPIMGGGRTNNVVEAYSYPGPSHIKLASPPLAAIGNSPHDSTRAKPPPSSLRGDPIFNSNPSKNLNLPFPRTYRPIPRSTDEELDLALLKLAEEKKKWRSIEYQESLIAGGFKLVCKIVKKGDLALFDDQRLRPYISRNVSPLRMSWIAPYYDLKGKKPEDGYDIGAAMESFSDSDDVPEEWRMTRRLAKVLKHEREKQDLVEKVKAWKAKTSWVRAN